MANCPHTARRRRSSLLNVLTGLKGRRGRANDLTEWIVTLRRVDVNYTKVVVQAKDWDDAAEQAEERVWTDRSIQWELQDPRGTDLEVIDAEEV